MWLLLLDKFIMAWRWRAIFCKEVHEVVRLMVTVVARMLISRKTCTKLGRRLKQRSWGAGTCSEGWWDSCGQRVSFLYSCFLPNNQSQSDGDNCWKNIMAKIINCRVKYRGCELSSENRLCSEAEGLWAVSLENRLRWWYRCCHFWLLGLMIDFSMNRRSTCGDYLDSHTSLPAKRAYIRDDLFRQMKPWGVIPETRCKALPVI